MQEHFTTLELQGHETAEEIKTAYRNLCKIHHPDVGGDPEKFKAVNHAYKSLTDPSYVHKNKKLNLNIEFMVTVSFDDAFFGGKITSSFNQFEIDKDNNMLTKIEQNVAVHVFDYPAGKFGDVSQILEGKGVKCGEDAGNAKINYVVAEHPKFKLGENRRDVRAKESIDLEVLLKGGTITVQTMYGLKEIKINAGHNPLRVLKVPGCGVGGHGDHLIDIDPIYPTHDEIKNKKKFKDLNVPEENFKQEQTMYISGYRFTGFTTGGTGSSF